MDVCVRECVYIVKEHWLVYLLVGNTFYIIDSIEIIVFIFVVEDIFRIQIHVLIYTSAIRSMLNVTFRRTELFAVITT